MLLCQPGWWRMPRGLRQAGTAPFTALLLLWDIVVITLGRRSLGRGPRGATTPLLLTLARLLVLPMPLGTGIDLLPSLVRTML